VDPFAVVGSVKSAIAKVDPELAIANVKTLEAHAAGALASRRFALWLFQAFAILAVALAAVGVYGLLAYTVQQRRRELGIRMALGATSFAIWRMVVLDGVRLAGVGAIAGAIATPVAGRLIESFLFGVQPDDVAVVLAAPTLLLCVALAAALAPAFTATRSEPASALRHE
jgi:putative ABC transport system permease protein